MSYVCCGRKTITASAVALGSSTVEWIVMSAPFMNKKAVKVGDSGVTDSEATTDGLTVFPDTYSPRLGACKLSDIYVIGKAGDIIYWVAGRA